MTCEETITHCSEPDCQRPAARGGRCWGHLKHLQRFGRTRPLLERPATPRERLERAAHDLGAGQDDDDEGYRRAVRRFRDAFRACVRAELAALSTPGRRMGR